MRLTDYCYIVKLPTFDFLGSTTGFLQFLDNIGHDYAYSLVSLPVLDQGFFNFSFHCRQQAIFKNAGVLPRTCPSRGATLCTYSAWFSVHNVDSAPRYSI